MGCLIGLHSTGGGCKKMSRYHVGLRCMIEKKMGTHTCLGRPSCRNASCFNARDGVGGIKSETRDARTRKIDPSLLYARASPRVRGSYIRTITRTGAETSTLISDVDILGREILDGNMNGVGVHTPLASLDDRVIFARTVERSLSRN